MINYLLPDKSLHNEKNLFLRINNGEEAAFELLFNKYVPILQPYLLDMLKSRQLVEDAIQDTFIRIWLYRDKLNEIEYPHTWIVKIAVNECLNILRKQGTEIKATEKMHAAAPVERVVEQDTQYHQTKNFIEEAVSLLPAQRRKIYEMSRGQGLAVSEIAEKLNLSTQTVKNTLGISIEFIRQHLAGKGIIIPSAIAFYFFCKYL